MSSNNQRTLGLVQVWPTDERETTMDVVAIHGLDTRSPQTWVAFENEADPHSRVVHWLKDSDMLPAFLSDTRIFTYDWNANTTDGASKQYFHSHAEQFLHRLQRARQGPRSVVVSIFIPGLRSCLITHIETKALTIAAGLEKYRSICKATCGIMFLGTPFRGSRGTSSGQHRVTLACLSGKVASHALLNVIDKDLNEGRLEELRNHFCDLFIQKWGSDAPLKVVCFYETEPTQITRAALPSWVQSRLVERGIRMLTREIFEFALGDSESACLEGLGREAINVRHAMLNKFRGRDGNFMAVIGAIQSIIRGKGHDTIATVAGATTPSSLLRTLTEEEQVCARQFRLSDYR
ncbi:hypothetical protein QBC35DRAFT_395403 [Podospora australis]|uniref:Uncharacterized protein n=1 Tax=Podospora australis TaxID=1536484 RepID=A0AAN6WLV9_9PEZI|nr:hypothetical protein QBC35DRAFT_395403 [Podospora australis]